MAPGGRAGLMVAVDVDTGLDERRAAELDIVVCGPEPTLAAISCRGHVLGEVGPRAASSFSAAVRYPRSAASRRGHLGGRSEIGRGRRGQAQPQILITQYP